MAKPTPLPISRTRAVPCPFCDGQGGVAADGPLAAGICPACDGAGDLVVDVTVTGRRVRLQLAAAPATSPLQPAAPDPSSHSPGCRARNRAVMTAFPGAAYACACRIRRTR